MGGPGVANVGIGSDFNGLGGQPAPRFGSRACQGDAEASPQANMVAYPFPIPARPGVDAGVLGRSRTPDRYDNNVVSAWDYNFDGLAHAGLLPDFIEDLRRVGVTEAYLQPLFRSAEAYVQMWQRAEGSEPPFEGGTLLVEGSNTLYRASSTAGEPQPVTATFAEILTTGFLVAEVMQNPPPPPLEHVFIGLVFDLIATASFTPPITVCIDGAFQTGDSLVHFESNTWVEITSPGASTGETICGTSNTLSPFGVVRRAITADTEAPDVSIVATPESLWPPDGTTKAVAITGTIVDEGGSGLASATFSVVDEYGAVQPAGSITVNADGTYSATVMLQASRLTTDADGRHYTITVRGVDVAGNTGTASATVLVPYFEDSTLQGRIFGNGRLMDGTTRYDVSIQAKERSSTGQLGHFNVKRHAPKEGADRFVSEAVTGIAFAASSGSLIDSVFYIGIGRWNGQAGYRFEAYAIDRGDPGSGRDEVGFAVFNQAGEIVATYRGLLTEFNIRSTTY